MWKGIEPLNKLDLHLWTRQADMPWTLDPVLATLALNMKAALPIGKHWPINDELGDLYVIDVTVINRGVWNLKATRWILLKSVPELGKKWRIAAEALDGDLDTIARSTSRSL